MKRYLIWALVAAAALGAPPASAQSDAQRVNWNQPVAPFRVIGNIWYVGTQGLSAFLITGPKGHVLIDGALPESAPLIEANIRALGFKATDIKYLLNNHSHVDHAGGLAQLKADSGAMLVASAGDAPDLEAGETLGRSDIASFPPVRVDRLIRDGEKVKLGATLLTANLTPGHTKGCTSWTMQVGRRTVIFACSLSVAGQKLADNPDYPHAADDFEASFAKLRGMKADVFLTFHPEFFDMNDKLGRRAKGEKLVFVDPGELGRRVASARRAFLQELTRQRAGD